MYCHKHTHIKFNKQIKIDKCKKIAWGFLLDLLNSCKAFAEYLLSTTKSQSLVGLVLPT